MPPGLVEDINAISEGQDSSPQDFTAFRNLGLFWADDGEHGRELWRSDGTPGGTFQLLDLCPGSCSPLRGSVSIVPGERIAFLSHDTDLWVTRGTRPSTRRLVEFRGAISPVALWVASQRALYFSADDREQGAGLWRSDGTPAGTSLVANFQPDSLGGGVYWLTELNGKVFFVADDGEHGYALWRTDGTPQGTEMIKDPLPNDSLSSPALAPTFLRVVGRQLLFLAPTPTQGKEWWRSDGTSAGTVPLIDLEPGIGSPRILDTAVFGNRLLFVAETRARGQELWITDGTVRQTRLLTNARLPQAFFYQDPFHADGTYNLYFPAQPRLDNRFWFLMNDGSHGIEMWTTDGTLAGTRLFRDLCPGSCWGFWDAMGAIDNRFFFIAASAPFQFQLWVTDFTPRGTRAIRNFPLERFFFRPHSPQVLGGRLLFVVNDSQANGRQLWATDGTAPGTIQLREFAEGSPLGGSGRRVSIPGAVLFAAGDPEHGVELWRTDGTPQGTFLLRDIAGAE